MSGEKRLFVGIVTLRSGQSIENEIFVDFCASENEAVGSWVKRAMARNPGYVVVNTGAKDTTDFVRQGLGL